MMGRRAFLGALGLLAAPRAAVAPAGQQNIRLGVLSSGAPKQESELQVALREGLRERGGMEGQNLKHSRCRTCA